MRLATQFRSLIPPLQMLSLRILDSQHINSPQTLVVQPVAVSITEETDIGTGRRLI